MSGARLPIELGHALKETGKKVGIACLCIGGGEATALAVEVL
jgi:acetyl-CoA C-acetyltransferase